MDDLLKKAISGDETAFNKLYEESRNKAYVTTKLYFKNDDDCLDVLQDAYMKAIKNLDKLDSSTNFNRWFNRIVENTCKNKLKKKDPQLFCDITNEEEQEPIVIDDREEFQPEKSQNYNETKRIVLEGLNALPEDQKMCLMKYYYDQYKISEIAEDLGISEATVRSRISYAKEKMLAYVDEFEKREGIRLHSVSIIPFAMWIMSQEYSKAQAAEIGAAVSSAGKNISAINTSKAAAAGSKIAGIGLKGKVIAGVVAALVIGGTGYAITRGESSSGSNGDNKNTVVISTSDKNGVKKASYEITDLKINYKFDQTPVGFYHKGYLAKVNGKYGFIDENGKKLVDFKYADVLKVLNESTSSHRFNGPVSSVCMSLSGKQYTTDPTAGIMKDSAYLENLLGLNTDTSNDCYQPSGYGSAPANDPVYWDKESNSAKILHYNYEINLDQHWDYINASNYSVAFADEIGQRTDIRVYENMQGFTDTTYDHKYHVLNKKGVAVTDKTVSRVLTYNTYNCIYQTEVNGLYTASAVKDSETGKWALLGKDAKFLTKFKYDSMEVLDQYTFKFKEGNKIGIIDTSGNILIEGEFEDVTEPIHYKALIKKDGKWLQIKL